MWLQTNQYYSVQYFEINKVWKLGYSYVPSDKNDKYDFFGSNSLDNDGPGVKTVIKKSKGNELSHEIGSYKYFRYHGFEVTNTKVGSAWIGINHPITFKVKLVVVSKSVNGRLRGHWLYSQLNLTIPFQS